MSNISLALIGEIAGRIPNDSDRRFIETFVRDVTDSNKELVRENKELTEKIYDLENTIKKQEDKMSKMTDGPSLSMKIKATVVMVSLFLLVLEAAVYPLLNHFYPSTTPIEGKILHLLKLITPVFGTGF